MPRIGELLGVFFYLYYQEHGVPHVHAYYQNHVAVIDLEGNVLEGRLPAKKLKLARRFALQNAETIQEMVRDIETSKNGGAQAPSIKKIRTKKK